MDGSDWREVLEFWFGRDLPIPRVIAAKSPMWWGKQPGVDQEIRSRFGSLHGSLAGAALDHWKPLAPSRLALIIVADQFSRNIYRGDPRSFASDPLALSLALEGIDQAMDRELRWIERVFFYLPLEHAESMELQEHCVRLFRALEQDAPAAERAAARGYLDYAERHREVIFRFGRFPHRNAILGRESTPEERQYLAQPGAGF